MSNVFPTHDTCLVQGWQGGCAAQDGAEHRQQPLHKALCRCSRYEAAQKQMQDVRVCQSPAPDGW